ncbi:MAG: hypothetical protein CMH83_07810 [Nocardioides sp.]|nr:hypothetical protein [Nocardioides sp.]
MTERRTLHLVLRGPGDPTLTWAMTVLYAAKQARLRGLTATAGRVELHPGEPDVVPELLEAWLVLGTPAQAATDAAPGRQADVDRLAEDVVRAAQERADRDGTRLTVEPDAS